LRRAKEEMPKAIYDGMTYYQRWTFGLKKVLVEKGVLTEAEIATRVAALRKKPGRG
jgi:hypothetical protein